MRCAHPTCDRGIGLASHRRGWFGKRLYCSRTCRDDYAAEQRPTRPRRAFEPSLLELLLAPASAPGKPASVRAVGARAQIL
jgi:hypothetical protein